MNSNHQGMISELDFKHGSFGYQACCDCGWVGTVYAGGMRRANEEVVAHLNDVVEANRLGVEI